MTVTKGWLTPKEAADYLKVKRASLLKWIRQGKVPAYAMSGTKRRVWRLRTVDLDSVLLSNPVIASVPLTVRCEREDQNA